MKSPPEWDPELQTRVQEIVGYLNFSSGARDPRFLRAINSLYAALESPNSEGQLRHSGEPIWQAAGRLLREGLAHLRQHVETFRAVHQAEAVLGLVFDRALVAYR